MQVAEIQLNTKLMDWENLWNTNVTLSLKLLYIYGLKNFASMKLQDVFQALVDWVGWMVYEGDHSDGK
jgi:hypothetical protein